MEMLILSLVMIVITAIMLYALEPAKIYPTNKVLNKYIKAGLKSGIKDIMYPSKYDIIIRFNNETSIIDGLNIRKPSIWLSRGVFVTPNKDFKWEKSMPSMSVMRQLDIAIDKWIKENTK